MSNTIKLKIENGQSTEKYAEKIMNMLCDSELELPEMILCLEMANQLMKDFLFSEGITYTCGRKEI